MSAVDEIRSAIEKLARLRVIGPDDDGIWPRDSELIVTLYRTIDAQIVGLRKGLDYLLDGWHEGGDVAQLALALARAINGGTK